MRQTLTALSLVFAAANSVAVEPIAYPEDYRDWTHVKSMVIHPGHPLESPFLGIHHVYANDKALRGLRLSHYEDGAALVFDQLAFQTADKASTEGDRVLLGVMIKDRERFPDTGGWGFEGWNRNSRDERLVTDGGASCYGCHTQVKEQDFVFTRWRD
jgi:hypothetical protein